MAKILIKRNCAVWKEEDDREPRSIFLQKGEIFEGLVFQCKNQYSGELIAYVDIFLKGNLLSIRGIPISYYETIG